MIGLRGTFTVLAGLSLLTAVVVHAGGPLIVNGAGEPLLWSASPVPFNPDRGGLGAMSNATAVAHLISDAATWTDVLTSTVLLDHAGQLPVDVDLDNFLDYFGVCGDDLSPVIFDDDGSITDELYGEGANNHVIGFAAIDCGTFVPPVATEGLAVLNGRFLDGIDNATNPELTADEFDAVMIHEFGHYLGLDHTQIGLAEAMTADPGDDAALATMFPSLVNGVEMRTLHLDDRVAISTLYPEPSFATGFGSITGQILLADGTTPFQGANVVARAVGDPLGTAVSQVSGARHFLTPGGPPPPALRGLFEIAGLPAGDYTVEIEHIWPNFRGGSSVGPLDTPVAIPGPPEFWNGANEAGADPPDDPAESLAVTVATDATTAGVDILVNEYPPPTNDECSAATEVVTAPFNEIIQTSGATRGAFDPLQSCTLGGLPSQNDDSVWYRYVPPADGVLTVRTLGSTYDTIITLNTGSCGSVLEVACNNNAPGVLQSSLAVAVSAGVPLLIDVASQQSGGTLQFALDFTAFAACPPTPTSGCRASIAAGNSPIKIRTGGDPAKDQLLWKWGKGAATSKSDLGTPFTATGTSYAFCLYDGSGTLVVSARIPTGGQCGPSLRDCWREASASLKYRDSDRTPDGIKSLDLGAGIAGKARIGLKGAGALLTIAPLPYLAPLTAQFLSSAGMCWEAGYDGPGIQRNEPGQLKAKDS